MISFYETFKLLIHDCIFFFFRLLNRDDCRCRLTKKPCIHKSCFRKVERKRDRIFVCDFFFRNFQVSNSSHLACCWAPHRRKKKKYISSLTRIFVTIIRIFQSAPKKKNFLFYLITHEVCIYKIVKFIGVYSVSSSKN